MYAVTQDAGSRIVPRAGMVTRFSSRRAARCASATHCRGNCTWLRDVVDMFSPAYVKRGGHMPLPRPVVGCSSYDEDTDVAAGA